MSGTRVITKTAQLFVKLLLFTLIVFWLTQYMHSGISYYEKDQYIEYVHQRDTLPTFFFSIVPASMVIAAKVHTSSYPQFHHFIQRKTQDAARVDSVLNAVRELEKTLFKMPNTQRDTFYHLRTLVHALLRSPTEAALDSIMDLMRLAYQQGSYPPTIAKPLRKMVQSYWGKGEGSRFSLWDYIPVIVWHGLDNQYARWLGSIAQGQLGISKIDGMPLAKRISSALQWTVVISIVSLSIMLLLGISLGMWMGIHHESKWSKIVSQMAFVVQSVPEFWLAVLLIVFFTTETLCGICAIFPTPGILMGNPLHVWQTLWLNAPLFVLVFVVTTVGGIAYLALQVKNLAAREWAKPYRFALMSKGLPSRRILFRHLLPNTLFPLLGLVTVILPGIFTGSLIVEVLFHLPGMGRLLYESIIYSDVSAIRLILLLIGAMTLLAYYATDLVLMYFGYHSRSNTYD